MGGVGRYLPSTQSTSSFANTLVALGNLREAQARGQYYRASQEDLMASRELARKESERKTREAELANIATAVTGQKANEPDVQQAMAEARRLQQPGALATIRGPITTTPESQSVTLVSRPPTYGDIYGAAERGAAATKAEGLAKLKAWGLKEDDPRYQYYEKSLRVYPPSAVEKELKGSAEVSQGMTKAERDKFEFEQSQKKAPVEYRKLEADTATAETGARVAARTEEATVEEKTANAKKATASATIESAKARNAEADAANQSSILKNEALAKQFEVSQQPEKARQLRLQNQNLQGEISRRNQEIAKYQKSSEIFDAWRVETDPIKKQKLAESHAMLHGHSGQLLSNDIAKQNLAMNLNDKASDLEIKGYQAVKEGTPQSLALGEDMYLQAGRMRVQSAIANNSNTVMLTIPAPKDLGYIRSHPSILTGSVTVPTVVGSRYIDRSLEAIAYDSPTLAQRPTTKQSGEALAWLARLKTAPGGKNDPALLTKFITESPAPQPVKEFALAGINGVMSQSNVTPGATVAVPGQEGVVGVATVPSPEFERRRGRLIRALKPVPLSETPPMVSP